MTVASTSPNEAAGLPIETYLRELAVSHALPDSAIRMCVLRYEEAGPALRTILERAAAGEDLSEDDATLLFRGLHVSGVCRDQLAFRPLLRVLARPSDELEWLFGDGLTQTMTRIVTSVFDGSVEALFGAITDLERDEYARSAAFGAATFLTFDGRIERERMVQFLKQFYEQRLADDWDYVWIDSVEAIALLGLNSLAPLAEKAWSEGRIPEEFMTLEEFKEDLSMASSAQGAGELVEELHLGYIEDAVDELEWTRGASEEDDEVEQMEEDDDVWSPPEGLSQPLHNPMRHVGRNDPCPCGSGKKAKRCCLATG